MRDGRVYRGDGGRHVHIEHPPPDGQRRTDGFRPDETAHQVDQRIGLAEPVQSAFDRNFCSVFIGKVAGVEFAPRGNRVAGGTKMADNRRVQ